MRIRSSFLCILAGGSAALDLSTSAVGLRAEQ
jgi:hypothetical protein